MKLYVEASSKKSLIQRLASGEEISGYNYSMFGGGGRYMLDDNLADGTIIAIYSKMVQGNPVAKSWGTWTNKVLKSETFEAMTQDENDTIVCSECNANVEDDPIYAEFILRCDCGHILYSDTSDGPYDIVDYYGAETFEARSGGKPLLKRQEKLLEQYRQTGGDAHYYDRLPASLQEELKNIKWHESLHQAVDRWLSSNKPTGFSYSRWGAEDENQCSVCGSEAVHHYKNGAVQLCDKHFQQQFGRYSAESFSTPYDAKRKGYIMGLTGIIIGWFINNQFFCRK
jgi:hypothetical protein